MAVIFGEISRTVKEIEANLCFAIFGKVAITQLPITYTAIFTNSNPMQAINPINLHTKFQKDRLNNIP